MPKAFPKRWRLASLTASSAALLLLAGCGDSPRPLWDYAPLTDDVARFGDGCDARRLLQTLIAAVNDGEVPPARQEELVSLANAVGASPCPGEVGPQERELASALAEALREGKPLTALDLLRRFAP